MNIANYTDGLKDKDIREYDSFTEFRKYYGIDDEKKDRDYIIYESDNLLGLLEDIHEYFLQIEDIEESTYVDFNSMAYYNDSENYVVIKIRDDESRFNDDFIYYFVDIWQ